MSNVSPFPAQRQPGAGHALQPDAVSQVARLVHAIDKAVGDKWSFDIVHHEVAGDETVVFARLTIDGRSRVGVGGTAEMGSLEDRLTSATVDALYRAAAWMGIAVQDDDKSASSASQARQPVSQEPANPEAGEPTRLSRKQLDFISALGRSLHLTREQVAARSNEICGRKPELLSKAQASKLIEALKQEVPS